MTKEELLAIEIRVPLAATYGSGPSGLTAHGTIADALAGSGYALVPVADHEFQSYEIIGAERERQRCAAIVRDVGHKNFVQEMIMSGSRSELLAQIAKAIEEGE